MRGGTGLPGSEAVGSGGKGVLSSWRSLGQVGEACRRALVGGQILPERGRA